MKRMQQVTKEEFIQCVDEGYRDLDEGNVVKVDRENLSEQLKKW